MQHDLFASDAEYDFANAVPFSFGEGVQLLMDDWYPIEAMYDEVYVGNEGQARREGTAFPMPDTPCALLFPDIRV